MTIALMSGLHPRACLCKMENVVYKKYIPALLIKLFLVQLAHGSEQFVAPFYHTIGLFVFEEHDKTTKQQ